MTAFALLLPVLLAQECVSPEFHPGPVSVDAAFHEGTGAAVQDLWRAEWGRGIAFVASSDSAGLRVTVHVEAADSMGRSEIAAVLEAGLAVAPPDDEPLRVLLHDGSRFIWDTVRDFRACPPALVERSGIGRQLNEIARQHEVGGETVLRAKLWVDIDGTVGEALLEQSSGSIQLDAAVLEAARGWRFTPARNEGIAVAVWAAFPITLRRPGTPTPMERPVREVAR